MAKNPAGAAGAESTKTTGSSGNSRRAPRRMTLQSRVTALVQANYSKKLNRLADQIRQIARGG